MLSNNQSINQ